MTGSRAPGAAVPPGGAGTPGVVGTRADLARVRAAMPGRVAVVMTMGALHAGHVALVRRARAVADHVVVTVFVNPLQFGAGEDLDRYPRDLGADVAALAGLADVVFAPGEADVYPAGPPETRVAAGSLGEVLEGEHRPGHFDGVLTVVSLLLHLTRPHVAVFGEKDAQQLALVRRLVADLGFDAAFGTVVESVPTVRDPDGLALSSRNAYLSAPERRAAAAVPAALDAAAAAAAGGSTAPAVRAAADATLRQAPSVRVDYVAAVDPATFRTAGHDHGGRLLVLVAARVGGTRLIDNRSVVVAAGGPPAGRNDLKP